MVSLPLSAQQDSLLYQDFNYLRLSDAWYSGRNAAPLSRLSISHLSDAWLMMKYENGGWANYDEAPQAHTVGAGVASYYRLTERVVAYGHISYDNYSGKNMAGSAFIHPEFLPFDIVEYTQENTGRKHLDTYQLAGAVSCDVYQGISLGVRMNYTAANYAKYKDLRHKNSLMDMSLTAGIYVPVCSELQIGAAYDYRRSTESVRFGTYGASDKEYQSLVSYGAFCGRLETFGENGYTDKSREMPLFSEYQGAELQVGWDILPTLSWYNAFSYAAFDGYYGKKSPYTVSYNQFDGKEFADCSRLTYRQSTRQHQLNASLSIRTLTDYSNTYREVTDEQTSARYYEYYTPVKLSDKKWLSGELSYTGYYGIRENSSAWVVQTGIVMKRREQKIFVHPYYRKQQLFNMEGFARAEHSMPLADGLLTAGIGLSYLKGNGDICKDGLLAQPSDKQTALPQMEAYLHREYQYLTAPRYTLTGSVKYAFIFPNTRMKTWVQLTASHTKAHVEDVYVDGTNRQVVAMSFGCTF